MELYIVNGFSIVACIIYGLMMLEYSKKIVTLKVHNVIAILITILLSSTFGVLSFQDVPYYFIYCLMYCTFMLCYYYGFTGNFTVFLFASGNLIFHLLCLKGIIVTLAALLTKTSMFMIMGNNILRSMTTIMLFLSASIFLVVFRKIFSEEDVNLMVKDLSQIKLIVAIQSVLNAFLIFSTLIYNVEIETNIISIYHLQLCTLTVISFYILFRNIIVTCLQKELKEKEETMKYQIQSQLKQYKIQSQYIKDLRRIKHDYNNQIRGVGYLLEAKDYNKAKDYVKELGGEINASDEGYVQFSNSNLTDAILQDINAKAIEANIKFEASVKADALPFTDLETCTIFSNLMNNALEASSKVKEKERFIRVHSGLKNGYVVIRVENSFNGELKVSNGKLKTSKKNEKSHGLGVERVENIVNEHEGMVEIRTNMEEKIFQIFLFVPVLSH